MTQTVEREIKLRLRKIDLAVVALAALVAAAAVAAAAAVVVAAAAAHLRKQMKLLLFFYQGRVFFREKARPICFCFSDFLLHCFLKNRFLDGPDDFRL